MLGYLIYLCTGQTLAAFVPNGRIKQINLYAVLVVTIQALNGYAISLLRLGLEHLCRIWIYIGHEDWLVM